MTKRETYRCIECGHEIRIYQKEPQAVYCTCEDEGPPMKSTVEREEAAAE